MPSRPHNHETKLPQLLRAFSLIAAMLLAATATTTFSRQASAYAFAPIDCTSPVRNYINYRTSDGQQLDPRNPNACANGVWGICPHYPNGNRTDWRRVFVANQYVSKLDFHFTAASVEQDYDYIYGGRWDSTVPDFQDVTSATGAPLVPFTWSLSAAGGNSFMSHPGRMRLYADPSVTGSGFNVDYLEASECNANSATLTRFMSIGERVTGVLLGTDDVVYLKFTMPGDGHASLALWGDPHNAAGTDFDVYLRCGALPTINAADATGTRVGTSEFLHVTTSNCSWGSTYYVAVHAYAGKGVFNLMPSAHFAERHWTLSVGMAADSGSASATSFNAFWRDRARAIYGATKGAEYIANIYNHTTKEPATSDGRCGNPLTSCLSMVDLNNAGGQTRGTTNGGATPLCNLGAAAKCVAYLGQVSIVQIAPHEWGHALYGLPDEYSGNPLRSQCGASLMSVNPHNYCFGHNHTYDPDPGAAPYSGTDMWNILYSNSITNRTLATTPDAYDFTDFDFANAIGTVTNPL